MSNFSFDFYLVHCSDSLATAYISIAFVITRNLFLLPLCVYVLHLGHRQWRQQRSFATTSHSDIFTYHMVALDLFFVLSSSVYIYGRFTLHLEAMLAGKHLTGLILPGQTCFHILTCVDRYLAVVHPILYLKLKQSGGVRIRNISTVCVWIFSATFAGLTSLLGTFPYVLFLSSMGFSLSIISFFSLRVLCVLIRPGPGEVGGNRDRVDQSKLKAFFTILAIMMSLCLWLVASLVGLALDESTLLDDDTGCIALVSVNWFSLPRDLVLPLLFLHRAGKLAFCH